MIRGGIARVHRRMFITLGFSMYIKGFYQLGSYHFLAHGGGGVVETG